MDDQDTISKFQRLLQDHPGASFAFIPADDLVPRDHYAVGIPSDVLPLPLRAGYGMGKAWGYAATLDSALHIAEARLADLHQARAA